MKTLQCESGEQHHLNQALTRMDAAQAVRCQDGE